MKVFKKMAWSILFASCFIVFMSCSSDENGDESVIPNAKQIKTVSDMTMSYNDGVLSKIVTKEGKIITFNYSSKTKSSSVEYTKMVVEDEDGAKMYFELEIGDNGFIKSCTETYENSRDEEQNNTIDTWNFEYNSDGQLIYMKRSEGGDEVTEIKYENGNITEVTMVSEEDDDRLSTKIYYTTEELSSAIENKNNIMLFDITFGIDMDEMKYAYWAGLLGKATKYLPVKITYVENSREMETETFQWTIKDDYIQKMIQKTSRGTEEHLFIWE